MRRFPEALTQTPLAAKDFCSALGGPPPSRRPREALTQTPLVAQYFCSALGGPPPAHRPPEALTQTSLTAKDFCSGRRRRIAEHRVAEHRYSGAAYSWLMTRTPPAASRHATTPTTAAAGQIWISSVCAHRTPAPEALAKRRIMATTQKRKSASRAHARTLPATPAHRTTSSTDTVRESTSMRSEIKAPMHPGKGAV